MGIVLCSASSAFAGSGAEASTSGSGSSGLNLPTFTWNAPTLGDWWNGKSGTANWLGLGDPLKDDVTSRI